MKTQSPGIWWLRLVTFVLGALGAASGVYWALKWSIPASTVAAPSVSRATPTDPKALANLLGGAQTGVVTLSDTPASRFKLMGVVTTGVSTGYALISVDGKPARSYRVGAAVNDKLMLHSLTPRSASLAADASAAAAFTLELPALAVATGKSASSTDIKPRNRATRSDNSD